MPATITGIVFNDLNNSGIYSVGDPGIANAYVVLYNATLASCVSTTTDINGNYSFSVSSAANYVIYETVSNPGATCPPTNFTQPTGFTSSNGPRKIALTITAAQISGNAVIANNNFSHSTNTNTVPCSSTFIQFAGGTTNWIDINLVTGNNVSRGNLNPAVSVNAIAYNPLDNYIYGCYNAGTDLVRVDNNKNIITLAGPTGVTLNFNVATIDANGFWYLYLGDSVTPQGRFYTIDLRPTSPTYLKYVDSSNGYIEQTSNYGTPLSSTLGQARDWAYNPITNLIYTVNFSGVVQSINPLTGTVTNLTTTGLVGDANGYGAIGIDKNGIMYALSNGTGKIYRVTISGNNATGEFFSQSTASSTNDGALCINAAVQVDFGDAPDSSASTGVDNYNTLLANNGPRHLIVSGLYLGTTITAESDAYQNLTATGDDLGKSIPDDGVTTPLTLYTNQTSYIVPVTITNTTGSVANLYGWIDYNKNGIFQGTESASVLTIPTSTIPQSYNLNFVVPIGVSAGHTFARVRLTTENLVNTAISTAEDTRSIGPATDGEVEDYYVLVTTPSANISSSSKGNNKSGTALVGSTINYVITIPNNGSDPATNVRVYDSLTPGLQLVGTLTISGSTQSGGGILTTLPGLNVGTIPIGNTAVVTFDVLVVSVPTPSNYINLATITYSDSLGSSTLPVIGPSGGTTIVSFADLSSSTKDNGLSDVVVGQIMTYRITIPNNGTESATNVRVYDSLVPGLQLVGTPTISGSTQSGGGILTTLPGLNVGTIAVGNTAVVIFDVLVVSIPS